MARMSCGLSLLMPLCGQTQDRAELEGSRIVGNRELSKVIYIVPWKKPLPDALSGKPPASVLDEVLAPIDRDVHRRHVSYHAQLASPGLAPPTPLPSPAAPAAAAARSATAARPIPATPQEKSP